MSDPADKDDVKVLVEKLGKLGESIEGMRAQNSAEHGSLFTKMLHVTELMHWLRARWQRFMDLPPPPIKPPNNKDDTQ